MPIKLMPIKLSKKVIQKRLYEWGLDINLERYYNYLNYNSYQKLDVMPRHYCILKWSSIKPKGKTDHGVISALFILKILNAMYYSSNPQRKYEKKIIDDLDFNQGIFDLEIVSACSAVFIHNIDPNYSGFKERINFKRAPLAFLLFLCDTFQEWDRYAEGRAVYSGDDFNIICTPNSILLTVPVKLEKKIIKALDKRLSGLSVRVNGEVAVKV